MVRSRKATPRPRVEALEDRLAPAVFNVNSLADVLAPPAGTVTLRSAIQSANMTADPAGNTINLTVSGTYKITLAGALEDNNATGDFDILAHANGNLTITNTSGGAVTVDGNHLDRVFDINPGNTNNPATKITVVLSGFTITNGVAFDPANTDGAPSSGGGARDQGNASLTLLNMVVVNNTASADGGGVSMENSPASVPWTLTINNSAISNNHAGDAGGGIETDGTGTLNVNAGSVISGNTCLNQGAGIWLDAIGVGSATLTMTGALVSNNTAQNGPTGAIGNAGNGGVTITDSTIANNFSGTTGGGFGDENNLGSLRIARSIFLNNSSAGNGGGIQEGGPTTTLTDTTLQGNSSGGSGGGLFASGTTVSVTSSTFASNTAGGNGGGIELRTTGTETITNSTFTGNRALNNASANGGGIDVAGGITGTVVLLNDTLNANFATNGGGIFWAGTVNSVVTLRNTILARNTANAGPDANNPASTFTDLGGNLIGISGAGSGNTGFNAPTTQTGTVATPLDPLLAPLANNGGPTIGATASAMTLPTEALLTSSPAIDKGVTAGAPGTDERGFVRPDAGANELPDVGAFETHEPNIVVTGTAGNDNLMLMRTVGGGAGAITYVLNGGSPVTLNDVVSFTFNGLGGNDVLTVSYVNGTPLLAGGATFDGGSGANTLVVNDSIGPGPTMMTVRASSINTLIGADSLTTNYTATGGSFAALGLLTGSGNDTVVVLGTAGPTNIATAGGDDTVAVAALNGPLGSVLIGLLAVNLGSGANTLQAAEASDTSPDVITVAANQFIGQGSQPFTINDAAPGGTFAGFSLVTGSGNDQIGVLGTAGPTGILTGGGNDVVGVAAQSGALGSVLGSTLSLDLGGGSNTLALNEANNTSGDTIALSANAFAGLGAQPFLITYAASGGTFASIGLTTGAGNDLIGVTGTAGTTGIVTGGGNDTVGVAVTSGSGYNLAVNGGVPTGGTSGDTLSVIDQSGGAVVHNTVSSAGNGTVQVLYAGGKSSSITYFDFEQVVTSPAGS